MVDRLTVSRRVWAGALALFLLTTCSSGAVVAGTTVRASTVSPLGHAIVFTRFLSGAGQGDVYRIDAGGSVEHLIRSGVLDFALLSRHGTRFTDFALAPDGRGSAAVFNVDGSGYRVLPIPDPTLQLSGGTWSAGDSRIVSSSSTGGGTPGDLYSRRSSDGGGLIRLTDAGTRADYPIQSSPDGSKLLFFRPDAKNQTSDSAPQDLFVVGADGSGLTRLTPPGVTTAVVFSYDSVSWSPDGTEVAVAAANGPFWGTSIHSVYIASADGSSFKRIGPRGNIWDAVWSPDGRWIAFSMASRATHGLFEIYLMHPDGSGVQQLTSGTNGLFSLHPTWSPNSDQLLFVRGTSDVNLTDIWSINVDGSHLYQITHQPANYGNGEALAWLP
jgi:Tol biopolymer transport system component